jgi:hypothetical protein
LIFLAKDNNSEVFRDDIDKPVNRASGCDSST